MKKLFDREPRDINLLRLIAGLFLIYLGWQLLSGNISGRGAENIFYVCVSVVFLLGGLFLAGFELLMYLMFTGKIKRSPKDSDTDPGEETEEK